MTTDSLPSGTVTLLFSDIEGSTQLLSRLGERYGEALSAQRSFLRSEFGRWGGTEMGTEGDSFFVVFPSATDAAQAALAAQRRLHAHDWPEGVPVRVRMGLHTGEPLRHEDGYIGMDVHRAARIAGTAHGGQVVLSATTAELVAGHLAEVDVQELGWHRLKDIPEPQHLTQLVAPGLPHDFPPLKSLGTTTNLPVTTTPIVGRAGELAELAALVADPQVRLVTLTGPGGSGKTRLAVAVAQLVEALRPDGVYFVALSAVTTAEVMWSTVGEVLGMPGEGRAPPTFFEHIAEREMLLILDNLEQVTDAPLVVSGLLAHAPGLAVLATSRRPLHVAGEYEHPVPPLEVPSLVNVDADVASWGAVALFVQRARMVRPHFELSDDNAADVVEICARLDGMPLALELAAARTKLLSPHALLGRLDKSLELSGAEVERPDRQRTLRNTIAWSYDLLTEEQQTFFRQLGVFAGGCDLDAMAAVVAGDMDPFDEVAELVDVSLVTVRDGVAGEPRVTMLQTIRAFARERLHAAGEWDSSSRRHAQHYLAVAEEFSLQLRGPQFMVARDRLELELDNFRAGLEWCLRLVPDGTQGGEDDAVTGLKMCEVLSWFWYTSGYATEGRQWLERAVERAADRETPELTGALHGLGVLLEQQGEAEQAKRIFERCLEFWRRAGDIRNTALELNSLAITHRSLGDVDTARLLSLEGMKLARDIGADSRLATALSTLSMLELDSGEPNRAIALLEEALVIDRRLGNSWGTTVDQVNLVAARTQAGQLELALKELRGFIDVAVSLNDVDLTIAIIELMAALWAEMGDARRAARLSGTAEAMREQANLPRPAVEEVLLASSLAKVRPLLDAEGWTSHVDDGRALSAEAAIAEGIA